MRNLSKHQRNNIIIGGLLSIVLLMMVGYAAFASKLNISGTSNITSNWDIEITNIESKNIVGSASNSSDPTYSGLTATFNTNLVSPGDSITYDITVTNKGSLDATLKKINLSDPNNDAIIFKTSGLKEGGTLVSGNSAVLSIKVTYDSSVTTQPDNLTGNITATLEFEQNFSGTVTPIDGMSTSDLKELVVTSGDGLYEDDTESGRYVYRGAAPDNYITLGSDTYRIIAVESDGTLKVIKNGSIGSMVFDLGYSTSISGVTDASSMDGTRYTSVSTDYCYYSSSTTSYFGCKVWGSKTTMLDSSGNNITTMPREVGGTSYNLPDTEAYINTYLNTTWLNSLSSTVQSKIVTHMFNVGVTKKNETSLANTITQEQAYKWKGKVGLMNVSDYVKASTNSSCTSVSEYYSNSSCYNNSATHNWIFAGPAAKTYSWTIAPYSHSTAYYVLFVYSSGKFAGPVASSIYGAAPVLYLSSNIQLSGKGTSGEPFTIS